jgi:alkylated DNA repair protein (DNA oxidative demethylase)
MVQEQPHAALPKPLVICPGAYLWRSLLVREEQSALIEEVISRLAYAPFFQPTMPRTGKPLSVQMTNFGALGWVSDQAKGYRYQSCHPATGNNWPAIPHRLLRLWHRLTCYPAPPEACLVNLYRGGARMGLHQDRDEPAMAAPVLSISLGDDAVFRIGDSAPKAPTRGLVLKSGDVLLFGGPARLCRHGIDRIMQGSSDLVPGGGRINLTLRKVEPVEIEQVENEMAKSETAGQFLDRPSLAPVSAGTGRG